MAGGVAGAVIGGTLGAAAGIAGGIADYNMAETLRQESLDYAQDQFDFSLQNIQARPDTLTRVGADTVDNPYFPFVEYYSCSSAEDTALENKIRYRGMTIDVIGSFKDYINNADPLTTYISGRLIKIDIEDDYHLVNEINNELQRGVYV